MQATTGTREWVKSLKKNKTKQKKNIRNLFKLINIYQGCCKTRADNFLSTLKNVACCI